MQKEHVLVSECVGYRSHWHDVLEPLLEGGQILRLATLKQEDTHTLITYENNTMDCSPGDPVSCSRHLHISPLPGQFLAVLTWKYGLCKIGACSQKVGQTSQRHCSLSSPQQSDHAVSKAEGCCCSFHAASNVCLCWWKCWCPGQKCAWPADQQCNARGSVTPFFLGLADCLPQEWPFQQALAARAFFLKTSAPPRIWHSAQGHAQFTTTHVPCDSLPR